MIFALADEPLDNVVIVPIEKLGEIPLEPFAPFVPFAPLFPAGRPRFKLYGLEPLKLAVALEPADNVEIVPILIVGAGPTAPMTPFEENIKLTLHAVPLTVVPEPN